MLQDFTRVIFISSLLPTLSSSSTLLLLPLLLLPTLLPLSLCLLLSLSPSLLLRDSDNEFGRQDQQRGNLSHSSEDHELSSNSTEESVRNRSGPSSKTLLMNKHLPLQNGVSNFIYPCGYFKTWSRSTFMWSLI